MVRYVHDWVLKENGILKLKSKFESLNHIWIFITNNNLVFIFVIQIE